MREVRVFDGDFPKFDDILSGNPAAGFPKRVWLAQVGLGEFAVRYKDLKTGLPISPSGERVQSSEVCRIFSSAGEARADSRIVSDQNWIVRCFIYDHTGSLVETVSNTGRVTRFVAIVYAGVALWLGIATAVGMCFLWLLPIIVVAVSHNLPATNKLFPHFGWLGWMVYAFAGLLIGMLAWYSLLRFRAVRRFSRMQRNLKAIVSADDRKRFEELNTLYGSQDPQAREKFLKLAAEYREKVNQALKK